MGNLLILLALLFLYLIIQSKLSNSNQNNSEKDESQDEDKKKKKPLFSETIGIFEGIKEGYADAKKIIKEADQKNEPEEEAETLNQQEDLELTVTFNGKEDKDIIDSLNEMTNVSEYIKKLVRNDLDK